MQAMKPLQNPYHEFCRQTNVCQYQKVQHSFHLQLSEQLHVPCQFLSLALSQLPLPSDPHFRAMFPRLPSRIARKTIIPQSEGSVNCDIEKRSQTRPSVVI